MINLLATAAAAASDSISLPALSAIIASIIAAGGGGVAFGRKTKISNDPLNVRAHHDCVPRHEHAKDIAELRKDIRDDAVKSQARHDRINGNLGEVIGQNKIILELLIKQNRP